MNKEKYIKRLIASGVPEAEAIAEVDRVFSQKPNSYLDFMRLEGGAPDMDKLSDPLSTFSNDWAGTYTGATVMNENLEDPIIWNETKVDALQLKNTLPSTPSSLSPYSAGFGKERLTEEEFQGRMKGQAKVLGIEVSDEELKEQWENVPQYNKDLGFTENHFGLFYPGELSQEYRLYRSGKGFAEGDILSGVAGAVGAGLGGARNFLSGMSAGKQDKKTRDWYENKMQDRLYKEQRQYKNNNYLSGYSFEEGGQKEELPTESIKEEVQETSLTDEEVMLLNSYLNDGNYQGNQTIKDFIQAPEMARQFLNNFEPSEDSRFDPRMFTTQDGTIDYTRAGGSLTAPKLMFELGGEMEGEASEEEMMTAALTDEDMQLAIEEEAQEQQIEKALILLNKFEEAGVDPEAVTKSAIKKIRVSKKKK